MHFFSFNPVYIHKLTQSQGNVKHFLRKSVIYLSQWGRNRSEGLQTLIPSTLCLFQALMLFGILWGIMGCFSAYILVYRSGNESLVSSPNRRVHITSSTLPSMRKASFITSAPINSISCGHHVKAINRSTVQPHLFL